MKKLIALVAFVLWTGQAVQAGNTWDGGGGDNNWGTGANWSPDGSPGPGTANDLFFAGGTRLTPFNNYTAWDNWRSIYFNSGAGAFSISGNQISFNSPGKIENNSASSVSLNVTDFSINGGSYEFNPVSGDLSLGGGGFIYNNGNAINVYGNNAMKLTIGKNLTQGGSLTVQQNSIVEFTTSSGFGGDTFINAGEVRLTGVNLTGCVAVRVGATSGTADGKFRIGTVAGGTTATNKVVIRGGSSGTKYVGGLNTSGVNTFSGPFFLDNAATFTNAAFGEVAYSGVIDDGGDVGTFGIAFDGLGTNRLSGSGANQNWASATVRSGAKLWLGKTAGTAAIPSDLTINAGGLALLVNANQISDTIDVTANGTLDLNNNTETFDALTGAGTVSQGTAQLIIGNNNGGGTFSGTLTGTGSFVKKGSATQILSGANTVSGHIFPVGGTLQFNVAQGSGFGGTGIWLGETSGSDTAAVAIGAGGVTVTNRITVRAGSSGTKFISANNGSGAATYSGPVVLSNEVTLAANSGGTLTVSGTIETRGSNLTATTTGTINLDGVISEAGKLVKQGAGTVNLSVANTYTGNTEIDLGTVSVSGDIDSGSTTYIGNGASGGNAALALAAAGVDLGGVVQINTDPGAGTRTINSSAASGTTTLSGLVRLARSVTLTATAGSTLSLSGGLKLDFSGEQDASLSGNVTISSLIDATSGASDVNYSGSGTLTLSGNNAGELFKLNITDGTVYLNSASALGTGYADKVNFSGGASVLQVGVTMAPASLGMRFASVSPTLQIDPGVTLTVAGALDATSGSPVISKTGTGTLYLTGAAASSDVGINVNAGVLQGTGIAGALDVNANARISPGASPGTMAAGNTTWDTDGAYTWEINDFAGTYGADPGWDRLNVTGTLTIGATSGNPFTIYLTSLTGASPGNAANFDNTLPYALKIASASTAISGFAANKFVVNTSGFSNPLGGGAWSIQQTGTDIELAFTPAFVVPTTNNATWDGGDAADANWQSWTNWVDDRRPATGGAATLNFAGSTRTFSTNDYTPGQQFNDLHFSLGAGSHTLRGNSLTISNKLENHGVNPQTVDNNLTLNGPVSTEINPVQGDLTLNGTVTVNGPDLLVYSDNTASGSTVRYNGAVNQGTGSSKLIVRQNATVEIAAANTLSDDIEIDRGGIHVEDGGSVAAGTAYIGNGTLTGMAAEFVITDTDGGTTVARTMNINDGTAGNRTLGGANTSGANTFSGSVNRTGGADKAVTLTAAAGGVVDYTGDITGDDNILIVGGGVTRFSTTAKSSTADMFISGNSTLRLNASPMLADSVDITVNVGSTLDLNGNSDEVEAVYGAGDVTLGSAQLRVNHAIDRMLSGVISGSGSVVKKGTAKWTLSGANSWSGSIFPVGGTLQFDATPGGGFTGTIQLGETSGTDAATLAIGVGGVTLSNPITVRSGSSGTKTIRANNTTGTATFNGAVTMNNPVTLVATAGGSLTFGSSITQNANDMFIENTSDVTLAGVTGSGAIEKVGGFNGTLIFAGDVNSGDIRHNDGKIQVGAGGDVSGAGIYYLGSDVIAFQYDTTLELAASGIDIGSTIEVEDATGAEVKTIRSTVAGTQTISGTVRQDDQDLILSSTNGSTLVLSGTMDMDYDTTVDGDNDIYTRGAGDITFSGQLQSFSGAMDLFTQGSGTVTLLGNNSGQSYQIENGGGTVYLNSLNALGFCYPNKIKVNVSGATTRVGVTMAPPFLGIQFTGSYTHTIQVDSGVTFTVPNTIDDGGFTGNLIKTGAGDLTVQAVNTLDGLVTVSAGTLNVSAGASFGPTTVSAGGYLKGNGIVGTLSVSGTVAPGASVGTLNAGATTFAPSGTNAFDISDFTGTYGTNPGWDKLNVTGALTITATAAQPFTIQVWSLLTGGGAGNASNFNNALGYTNTIATASGGISGFAANKFSVNTSNFSNPTAGGTWAVQQTGNDLELVFTPSSGLAQQTVIQFK